MSDIAREALEGAEVKDVLLTLYRIEYGGEEVCVVKNTEPVYALGRVYLPLIVEFTPPSLGENGIDEGVLRLDTTDLGAQTLLASVREPPKLRVDVVLSSTPDDPLATWRGLILIEPRIFRDGGAEICEFKVTSAFAAARSFPKGRFTPGRYPGLFS